MTELVVLRVFSAVAVRALRQCDRTAVGYIVARMFDKLLDYRRQVPDAAIWATRCHNFDWWFQRVLDAATLPGVTSRSA